MSGVYAWATICALCGFAKTILNHPSALLSHLTEAVLPVYVVHQPILLVTAYWLFPLGLPLPVEALLLAGATSLGSFAIYEGLIRPFPVSRFLFGLKPRLRYSSPSSGALGVSVIGNSAPPGI